MHGELFFIDSSISEGITMIDMHSHILPGLDDGSPDLQTSLAIASAAVENGIRIMLATPHFIPGVMKNSRTVVLNAVQELQFHLDREKIPLRVLPGTEAYCDVSLPQLVKSGEVLTVNDSGKYLLMELPMGTVPHYMDHVVFELKLQGITPVIAHPERNKQLAANPDILYKLIYNGALTQVNAVSILGDYGGQVKAAALLFLKLRWVHFLGTDTHSLGRRIASLNKAKDYISNVLKMETEWINKNPELVLKNECVNAEPLNISEVKCGFLDKLKNMLIWKKGKVY